LNSINYKDLKKKASHFNEKKIINIFNYFINLKKVLINAGCGFNFFGLLMFYLSIKKVLSKHNIKSYNTILQLKLTKKQLFSTIFNKKKIALFVSNGLFLKKLVLKKNQKKDSKVSILNLKRVVEFLQKKNVTSLVINIMYSKNYLVKYLNFFKSSLKNTHVLYFYSPKLNFSKKKFKKIKSIKRKLKKKYVFSV
jgi:hypothetical protein